LDTLIASSEKNESLAIKEEAAAKEITVLEGWSAYFNRLTFS
jgi:hypothetical protein